MNTPALRLANISKRFDASLALDRIDIELRAGEIHALCGQNGSGKSTLIKILAAYHAPESGGRMWLDGCEIKLPLSPGQPEELGIRFVHQDLGLADDLSILDNLYVAGYPKSRIGTIRSRAARRLAAPLLERFGLDVSPSAPVASLRPAERAILAVARAMRPRPDGESHVRVLLLDEPTAHLPVHEVATLMRAIRAAAADGVAVAIVTHRIDEILRHTDHATVLRDGHVVAVSPVADLDHDSIVRLLLGRDLGDQYPPPQPSKSRPRLELRGFSTRRATDVNLTVHESEILGVTGLIGSGFEDLPYGIIGAESIVGEVLVMNRHIKLTSPHDAISAGIGLVPADRLGQAGVTSASLVENLTLPYLARHTRRTFIDRRRELQYAADVLNRYNVVPKGSPKRALATLSGGNQQKLLLARWVEGHPQVLLLHEPTQGVDVGSRKQLFEIIASTARKGCAVLLASVQYADLAAVCHRVIVMGQGRVVTELQGMELDEDRIAEACLKSA